MKIDSHQHFWHPSRGDYYWMDGEGAAPIRRAIGPDQLRPHLKAMGVDRKRIHIELFSTPVSQVARKEVAHATAPGAPGSSRVKVILDGREHELVMDPKGDAVLDAAIDAGLDVPYACKGAVCCTCKARVVEGKVEMAMNYALTDEEVADGYVLTCQTHPRSARVVIDYDQH